MRVKAARSGGGAQRFRVLQWCVRITANSQEVTFRGAFRGAFRVKAFGCGSAPADRLTLGLASICIVVSNLGGRLKASPSRLQAFRNPCRFCEMKRRMCAAICSCGCGRAARAPLVIRALARTGGRCCRRDEGGSEAVAFHARSWLSHLRACRRGRHTLRQRS